MEPPKEFLELLPKQSINVPEGPVYWLWVFDPQTGRVTIDHNEDRSRADAITHAELSGHVTHPNKVCGYAYKIQNGFRITDIDHRPVEDPFITNNVIAAIKERLQ